MQQHIPNYLFFIVPTAAGIAFLVSLTIFFQPAKERYLKYFSFFLLANWILEMVSNYLALAKINNIMFNNLGSMLLVTFELWLVREIVYKKMAKKVLFYIVVCYPLFALTNIFFIQRGDFHTTSYSIGCLLIVLACIYYFLELFQRNYMVTLARQPGFWICSGLLFYYCCTFPLYGFTKLMQVLPVVIIQNLVFILDVLSFFLYLSFSIAYLCRLKTRKSMSSF